MMAVDKIKIYTDQNYIGHWITYDENYDGSPDAGYCPVGYGVTKKESIDDYYINREV